MSTPRLPWDDDVPEAPRLPRPAREEARPSEPPPPPSPGVPPPHATNATPSLQVCVHGAAAARLAAVRQHVLAHRARGVRVLAPTHEQAHDVVRHALSDQVASLGVERGGWVGFSVRLATPTLIARGLTPISGLGFEAVVARVVARARDERVLAYFADASRHPGFVPSLARTLADVRLARLAPQRLNDGTPKGEDLAWLLEAVVASLRDLGHADRAEILGFAAAAAADPATPALDWPLALVDPPLASRSDVELACALLSRSAHALVSAPAGDAWVARLLDRLDGWADAVVDRERAGTPPALRRVQSGLFEPAAGAARDGDPSVECLSAPGEGRECVEVARALLTHAEQGTPFDRMAVVMRSPELYASHLETALRRAGVPAYFGRGTRRPDPAGRAFLALLACAAEDLSARRFAEYLSLGQVPVAGNREPGTGNRQPGTGNRERATGNGEPGAGNRERATGNGEPGSVAARRAASPGSMRDDDASEGASGIGLPDDAEALGLVGAAGAVPGVRDAGTDAIGDAPPAQRSPWRWEAILNDAQVIGGAERWERRLRGYREETRLRAEAAFKDDPSSPRHESLARRVTWTDELIAFAGAVVVDMAGWPAQDDWGGWLSRLQRFAPTVLAHPERVLATLAELQPLSGVSHVGLAEVCDVLRDRLTHLAVRPPDHRYGRVFVGTPDQVRARVFDVVCVLGLSERVFPQRSRQDPLLLDGERAALSPDLMVDDDRVAAERLQLRLAVGAASCALLASYASMETAQARPRVPSFYAVDVQRAVTGQVPGYEALIRDAQQRSGARLAWPAPQQPADAIDAAEHDLSVLQQHLRGPEADVAGRARYLFGLNPALRRALVARHHRLSRSWSVHDGLVMAPDALAGHRLQARTYSASALQRFATCPYQFYLSTILRLERREEAVPLTTLDPLTRGSMVHEMLATIMRAFIERAWVPLTGDHLVEAQAVADAIVSDVASHCADTLMPPILRVWDDAIAAIRRDIHEWVRRLTDDHDGWTPVHVEMGVGFSGGFGRDEASRRESVVLPDGTRLHGVVDLIERRGEDEFRITDYKTGKHRLADRVVVNGGRTLQPILYAMAVEAAFGGRVTASRLYYCTDDGNYKVRDWPVTGVVGEQARTQGLEVLAVIDRAVAEGQLPAAPDEDACTWCDFTAVCGPGSQHLPARKDQKPLAELKELRRWR